MPLVDIGCGLAVSRETFERLKTYEALLRKWQPRINLIANSTLPILWQRHIVDSVQLADLATGSTWLDIGTGAGLPGLPLGILFSETNERQIHLVESDTKKCAFLREAAAATGARVLIHNARAEALLNSIEFRKKINVVTARAVTSLANLLEMISPLLITGATALLPKGQNFAVELSELRHNNGCAVETLPSRTDALGRILRVKWQTSPQQGEYQ